MSNPRVIQKGKIRTNPNGANQWVADPRQKLFLEYYKDPNSETFSNAYRSAIRAGYKHYYANIITLRGVDWFHENTCNVELLEKAEKVLAEALEIDVKDKDIGGRALEASKFVARGIGKDKYADRTELTSKDGKELPQPLLQVMQINNYVSDNDSNKEGSIIAEKD